ncbi:MULTISPECIES: EAL domain-containing protein [unclassified Caballeronia]|uniref:EAL domain-containing protein n=1 Tax=unclassified Caballeronia TaxID=2646786 RepID=UPI00286497AB|nr:MULTISPECIES: EAL domain-containing protein [unclassified Caballeronia]MDR5753207.1 EAL domain-containing protein [Caballeronia sp. LZ024]MDR5840946.1 EAL domain-containing protein [Caballeronia sp. LZ031]
MNDTQHPMNGRERVDILRTMASTHPGGSLSPQRAREGLRDGEFTVAYQPVVKAKTLDLLAVECLIRWQHPELGVLLPGSFMTALEDTVTARAISYFVLETACHQLAGLQHSGVSSARATINIQPSQLADRELSERIVEACSRNQIEPSLIELELLETENASQVLNVSDYTRPFEKLGVRFALDDFGSGYSSLAMLGSTRIQTIKLDRAFIAGVPASTRACTLLTSILQLLDRMGFLVVVEGVETMEQLRWLALHPEVFVQGYYIARPQTAILQAVRPFN